MAKQIILPGSPPNSGRINMTFGLRIYPSQAAPVIANLRASRLHEQPSPYQGMELFYLIHSTSRLMAESMAEARAIGLKAVPGMRILPKEYQDWVNPEMWADRAKQLQECCDLRESTDRRVQIDIENYSTKHEAVTPIINQLGGRDVLLKAMAPFLQVLLLNRVIPMIHPAQANDEVSRAISLITEANYQQDEGTFEHGFQARLGHERLYMSHLLPGIFEKQKALEQWCPNARYMPGFVDETLRNCNAKFREFYLPLYAKHGYWLFIRDRANEKLIGTQQWLDMVA